MPSPAPTPGQIQTVQTNLQHMQHLNDYVYTQGQSKILNAYALLAQTDSSDPGLIIGLDILKEAFSIAEKADPFTGTVGSIMCGILSFFATATPPSLNNPFSSLLSRTQQTSLELDRTLATIYQDVAGSWTKTFTYNGQSYAVSDLATAQFPDETDPKFLDLAANALFAFDQSVWTYLLSQSFKCTRWVTAQPLTEDASTDPAQAANDFITKNPAYDMTWAWHARDNACDQDCWYMTEISLGGQPTPLADNTITSAACAYLFIDTVPGHVINAKGLFTRATVFNDLNIPKQDYIVISQFNAAAPRPALSKAYLRAMKEGNTLSALIKREGRAAVEQRIIAKARADHMFARDLALRPVQTLETFLEVKIPEIMNVQVIREGPLHYGLVLPFEP